MLRTLLATALLSLAAALPLQAQTDETPAAILVLDGSGSMWGQIDGVNKIVIAREVISDMLDNLPSTQALGLTLYGHRTRGDCSDIETVIAPGLETRDAIRTAVNEVNPRGRTPMTDAVVEAAHALRHTENAATVILVSDGIETCEADPCAIAAELEEAGISFTAHVIGFDVASEPEARAQMQCIADNTGGQFLTADNAEELAAALEQVAVAPAPLPTEITFRAAVEPDMTAPVSPLTWEVLNTAGTQVVAPTQAPTITADLLPGGYQVQVLRMSEGTLHATTFMVEDGVEQTVTVTLPFIPPPLSEVTFTARIGSETGPLVPDPVFWEITPAPEGQAALGDGNIVEATLPDGSYEISATWSVQEVSQTEQFVVVGQDRSVLVLFEEPPVQAALVAPAETPAGSTIEIGWTGPGAQGDFIALAQENGLVLGRSAFTRDGNPVELRVLGRPGDYTLWYFSTQTGRREMLAPTPITITPVTATLDAPDTAIAGSTIEVGWTGPDYDLDFIAVTEPGATSHGNYTLTREGNPLDLQMPAEPGTYELRYTMQTDREIVTTRMIEVTDVVATLTAPETAVAGSTIEVGWTGPDYQNDFIGIGAVGEDGSAQWENYTLTREGSPLDLLIPTEPGDYVIRYFVSQDRRAIAEVPISVTEVQAEIVAPEAAVAGSTIEVGWTGPDNANDFIGIGRVDADGSGQWENYTLTREGAPLDLLMPVEPGEYVIRYFLRQDNVPIAERAITITEVTANLTAPASAVAGSSVEVGWTGPGEDNDFIGVGRVDADGSARWENYTLIREGNPLDVVMPVEPGEYVIQYFLRQDNTPIASTAITLSPVTADLTAPQTAAVGASVEVGWVGPGYDNDFIGVGRVGADGSARYDNYTLIREGNPLEVVMPVEPGEYVIQYFLRQDNTPVGEAMITLTGVTAELAAPASGPAGGEVEVTWTGPGYDNDFIGIGRVGEDGSGRYERYTLIREGSPLTLRLPDAPGDYEIQYFLRQDNTAIASRPFRVE